MAIDRIRVKESFSRGALEYDDHTPVQQRVINSLVSITGQRISTPPEALLDIGCGTGRLLDAFRSTFPDSALYGLDISQGMLARACERLKGNAVLVNADAEHLPFDDSFFDLVISSSTFQWLDSCETCFKAVRDKLKPGGQFIFAMFGEGTLKELHESWRDALAICNRDISVKNDGTHRFHSVEDINATMLGAGFIEVSVRASREVVWYPDIPAMLHAIKRIGAGSSKPPSGGGLGWRRVIHEMANIYMSRFGRDGQVPATYKVIYGIGKV